MNCTRLKSSCSAAARVRTSSVLATPGNAFQQHVAAAQQRDHQAADHGVLADDRLGDLAAQGQQRISCGVRRRRRSVLWAESRLSDLPFDVVEFVGEVDQVGVGGRGRAEQRVRHRLSGHGRTARRRPRRRRAARRRVRGRGGAASAAASPCAAHRRRGHARAATGTAVRGPRRSPRRGPRPASCSATSGPMRRPFHSANSATTRHSCRTTHLDLVRDEVGDRCAATGFATAFAVLRCVPDDPRMWRRRGSSPARRCLA